MNSITLKLKKSKAYTQDYISARHVRNGLKLQADMNKEGASDIALLDEAVDFVVSVFDNNEVTQDTILDGLRGEKMWETLGSILGQVIRGDSSEDGTEGK